MAYCTINSEPVFQATISFPRLGAWHADLAVASDVVPSGKVTLTFGGISWQGSAYRGGSPFGTTTLRITGGAGGIATGVQLTAQAYQGVALQIPLQQILQAAGETLSPNADPSVLSTQLKTWNRLAGPAGMALSALVSSVGASWRFMPDGTLWVGLEKWPVDSETYLLLNDSPMYAEQEVYADAPNMRPGTTFNGRKVSYVQHRFREEQLHTTIVYEDQVLGLFDRVKGPLAAFVRAINSNLYAGSWEGTIVSQAGAVVDFSPDDPRCPPMQAVPLKLGTAYVTATLSTPCRGVLFYANQDPTKPRVGLVDADAQFSALNIGGGTPGLGAAVRAGDVQTSTAGPYPIVGAATVGSSTVTIGG